MQFGKLAASCGFVPRRNPKRKVRALKLAVEVLEDRSLLSAGYLQTNLVSDIPGLARATDSQLTNPWGIAFEPGGPFWISDNHAGVSTLYAADGQEVPLSVHVPENGGFFGGIDSAPTSTVFNGSSGFAVAEGGSAGPSLFLFATEDGTISGWNPFVDDTHAILAVDNSGIGADYKGLAIGTTGGSSFLYAADFGTGSIDVFNQNFQRVQSAGSFTDPNLPLGYAPFNVQNIGGKLFVTYALPNGTGDAVYGPGQGLIDVFDTDGHLLQRFTSGGSLNAPWGLALAPADFGAFSNDLLVGNVGDGHINAFDPNTGALVGQLKNAAGNPITLPDVWGLTFGGGGASGAPNTLFFTAGVNNENNGLFGSIQPPGQSPADASSDAEFYASGTTDTNLPYPLPPLLPPTFHDGNDGRTADLPVMIPLKLVLPAAAPVAGETNLPPTTSSISVLTPQSAEPLTTAGLGGQSVERSGVHPLNRDGVTDWQLIARQTNEPESGRLGALDLLLAVNTRTDASEGVTTAVEYVSSGHEWVSDAAGIVPVSMNAAAPSKANAAGETDGASSAENHETRLVGRKRGDFWFSLPLALGFYLAWSCRHTSAQTDNEKQRWPSLPVSE